MLTLEKVDQVGADVQSMRASARARMLRACVRACVLVCLVHTHTHTCVCVCVSGFQPSRLWEWFVGIDLGVLEDTCYERRRAEACVD